MPEHLATGWRGEAGQHPQKGGLPRAGGTEQGQYLTLTHGDVGGGDDLNTIGAGLGVVLLDAFGTDDGLRHKFLLFGDFEAMVKELLPRPATFAPLSVSLLSTREMDSGSWNGIPR